MNQAHVLIGRRERVIPFVRRSNVVAIKFSEPSNWPTQKSPIDIAHKFCPQASPGPASLPTALNGAYAVQPEVGGPSGMKKEAWRLSKALHILCYLCSRRNHRAPKETLVDLFWSDAEPDTVAKNFHPTISHMRKALNSGQVVKKDFVQYREGAYLLNPQYRYRLDTEEFERLLGTACKDCALPEFPATSTPSCPTPRTVTTIRCAASTPVNSDNLTA